MTADEYQPVRVSRRIEAPAADIFRVLADPRRHLEIDGSGMLRGAVADAVITGVGDIFTMRMYYSEHGDYEMDNHVVEFEQDRRIGWEPWAGRGHPDTAPGSTAEARWGHVWSYELTPDGPGCDDRHRDLRLLPRARRGARGHGQRQDLDPGHGRDRWSGWTAPAPDNTIGAARRQPPRHANAVPGPLRW